MYLKSLEIHGFKSFADKTKLEFGPGITCIVGPNGSGKSNICDALRWVLGEQSIKTLRGAKLEDVIFNGSESRKPLGMAAVTLVFDNASGLLPLAFDEVTVSRRVYRSGESEFLINKVPCRLKDIQELFHDTGVGKEAFAIIGQGQIDAILSSRPEERRALFEEAAGIIRYRNRKIEAARKLESTSANLDRLQDLLFEIEQNLPPLKEEAEKARQHLEWSRELEALEISLSCLDLEKMSLERVKVQEQEKELEKRLWELEANHALLTTRWEESKLTKQNLEEQLGKLQEELYRRQKELSQIQGEITIAKDRIVSVQDREVQLHEEQKQNEAKRAQLEEECAKLQQEYDLLLAASTPQEEAVAAGESQLLTYRQELAECRERDNRLKENLFDAEQKVVTLNNKQLELQFELKNLKQQSLKLKENEGTLERHRQELQEQLEANEVKLSEYRERLVQMGQARRENSDTQQKIHQLLGDLTKELQLLSQAKHGISSRIKVLEEMKENLEGYQAGVRNLLRKPVAQGELSILGVVGELLKVPSQYERAVETALGSAVQNLVTETDEDAQAAIQWLKKENAGRATFLPLNTLKPRLLAKEYHPLLGEKGVLGVASDLVEIVPGLEKVLDYLLGNIIVVRDLATGRLLARKSRYSLKIVTLDGDILFPGGSLTGGSHKNVGSGLLGRNREIGEQKNQLRKLEAKERELQQKLREMLEHKADLEKQWQQLGEESSRLEMEIARREGERSRLKGELAQQQKLMEQGRWEEEQLVTEESRWQRQLAEVEQAKAVAVAEREEISRQLGQNKAKGARLEEQIRSLTNRLTEQKVQLAAHREKLRSLESSLSYYRQNHQEALEASERLKRELNQLVERKGLLNQSLAQLEEQEHLLLHECHRMDGRLKNLAVQVQEAQADVIGLERQVGQLAKELKDLKEQHHQVAMQLTRLEVEWDNAVGRLGEKFQLTWEEAKEKQVQLTSRREAENRVRSLRKMIDGLGLVNPNAMTEYQKLEERYRFLKNQQEDLLEAREGLFKIIAEMEKIMGQRFRQTFKEVENAFQEVFAYLFDGGKAALELTDGDNLLECGIEIIAQPPGKKMQHLSLLSGGERALTATALLFALLKVKPSPFCVLDEIEANLDETNVDRVAKYLRQFAQQTQFILVSHRQGTMEAADALYGVTMEESGVSRLVSVRLTPAAEVG